MDHEFAATLMTLSFLGSRKLAEAYVAETKRADLEAMAETIRRLFPDALFSYAHLGRSIHRVLMEDEGIKTEPRRVVKTGRNDPCPCGSGRKYKKCCGRHDS